ncbi:hypothetical protein Godav_027863 [Gossypium davidsonii]|uniref:Uncharacterized protein n=1 Tax=Gossypium davidsonii TaxID=34287 RepID=A0A7J8RXK6_GOSDV|nr:hypothetical protein [Gossypium davidsonii]
MNKEVSSDGVMDLDDTRGGQPSFEDKLVSITKVVGKLASWDNDLEINILEEDVVVSREGHYPEIQFLNRVHELSDKSMEQVLIVRLLGQAIVVFKETNVGMHGSQPRPVDGHVSLSQDEGLDLENRQHQGTSTMLGVDKDMDTTYS